MADKYLGIERNMFAEAYSLFLKYKDMRDDDDAWTMFINDQDAMLSKWEGHPLMRALLEAVCMQIKHRVQNTQLKGYTPEQWDNIIKAKAGMQSKK